MTIDKWAGMLNSPLKNTHRKPHSDTDNELAKLKINSVSCYSVL